MELLISDYRKILSILDDLGRARDLASFMRDGVAGLHRLAPSEAISFHEIWFRERPDGSPCDIDVRVYHEEPYIDWGDEEAVMAVNATQRADDLTYPLCRHHNGQTMLAKLSDAVTADGLRRLAYYQILMHPYGREFEWKMALPSARGTCRAFVATRQSCDYSEREMSALAALHPHVVHAFAAVRDRLRVERALAAQAGSQGLVRLGVLVLGAGERIDLSVDEALPLFKRYLGEANSHLPSELEAWVSEQRRRALFPEVGLPPTPFEVERGDRRLSLRFLQDADGDQIIVEESFTEAPTPALSFRLTAREIEALRYVGQGLTNKEVARQLGVTADTVRKHLENAFAKLGVGTRTAAVAKAFGLPAANL